MEKKRKRLERHLKRKEIKKVSIQKKNQKQIQRNLGVKKILMQS